MSDPTLTQKLVLISENNDAVWLRVIRLQFVFVFKAL